LPLESHYPMNNERKKHPHLQIINPSDTPPDSDYEVNQSAQVVVRKTQEVKPAEIAKLRWSIYISIMKPITWVPVVWSFLCGAVGTGGLRLDLEILLKLLVGLILSGPLLCGMGQAINDYFDREVDAVNEPSRAIPSLRITLMETYRIIGCLGFLGLLSAYYLGTVVFFLSLAGIGLAHAYSAPPLRLKRFTWLGPLTSAVSYIAFPWLAAASIFGEISPRVLIIISIYSLGATGIMISNDFKSIVGDYALKLPSVPVVYGTRIAARITCALIDSAQLAVIAYLILADHHFLAAAVVLLLMLPQLFYQKSFLEKPLAKAIWYNSHSQIFFVTGMLVVSVLTF